ncbi:MAG TPA: hypothetical protein VFN67_07560, partial [Polyangiales bacterium]|nr:hypothetical protein [Polyangiales bacterium]
GPHTPHLDDQLQPLTAAAQRGLAELPLCDVSLLEPLLNELASELDLASPFSVRPAEVEAAVHEDHNGPRVLFLLHTRAREVQAELTLPEPMVLVDALTGERYEGKEQVAIPLAGDACRMFVCERTTGSASRSRPPSARRSYPPC